MSLEFKNRQFSCVPMYNNNLNNVIGYLCNNQTIEPFNSNNQTIEPFIKGGPVMMRIKSLGKDVCIDNCGNQPRYNPQGVCLANCPPVYGKGGQCIAHCPPHINPKAPVLAHVVKKYY